MDKQHSKVPKLIALGLSTLSFALVINGWIIGAKESTDNPGIGSFLWVCSVIAGACAVFCYYHDAVQAAELAKHGDHPLFNKIRAAVLFLGIPMGLIFGLRPGWSILIWNGYHLVMCVLEVVSLKRSK